MTSTSGLILFSLISGLLGGDSDNRTAEEMGNQETRIESPARLAPVGEFTFIHMSDTHVNPFFEPLSDYSAERSYLCMREAIGLKDLMVDAYRDPDLISDPEFLINTGDVSEYGFPGITLGVIDEFMEELEIPQFWVAGNHDNTWVTDTDLFKKRYGGLNYMFEYEEVYFIGLNTATIQDPVPSFSHDTLQFLEETLDDIDEEDPVIIFFHHPISTGGFASDYEQHRFLDRVRKNNVVAVLVGHTHSSRVEKIDGIDFVHGGSTFSKGADNSKDGFNIVHFDKDFITIAFRFCETDQVTGKLLQKPRESKTDYPEIDISSPSEYGVYTGDRISVSASTDLSRANLRAGRALLNGETPVDAELSGGSLKGRILERNLKNGAHYLKVEFDSSTETYNRTIPFFVDRDEDNTEGVAKWRKQLDGGIKANPFIYDETVYVPSTTGKLYALKQSSGSTRWTFEAGGEIVSTPIDYLGYILFGSGDGRFYSVSDSGELSWDFPTEAGIFSSPVVDDDYVYFGNNAGEVYAIDAFTGRLRWVNKDAQYSVEAPVTLNASHVIFGAWDGYVYALDKETGETIWKQGSAMNMERKSEGSYFTRYYGPADAPGAVINDYIYYPDRGYRLGKYDLEGNFLGSVTQDVTAITDVPGTGLFIRRVSNPPQMISTEGDVLWEGSTTLGRIPAPATYKYNKIYALTSTGQLEVYEASSGQKLWDYKVTPDLYVFSSPAVDIDENVYTTDIDGWVTCIQPPKVLRELGNVW